MKLLFYLILALLLDQPKPRRAGSVLRYPGPVQACPTPPHWCDQPIRKLRWLQHLIQNAQSWPPYHYGWEVHQARRRGQEIFVLHLCRYCGSSRFFLFYNHYGELIDRGEGADSAWVATLTNDRILAAHPGRFMAVR